MIGLHWERYFKYSSQGIISEDLAEKKNDRERRKHLGEEHSRKAEHTASANTPKEAKRFEDIQGAEMASMALSRVSELRENEEMPSEK